MVHFRKYEAAMDAVIKFEGKSLKKHNLFQVGRAYLDHLLSVSKFNEAGKLCLKILGVSLVKSKPIITICMDH